MKIIKLILSAILISTFLMGCSTKTDSPSGEIDLDAKSLENTNEEGYTVGLHPKENEKNSYIFTIKNVGSEPMKLNFPSTQKFDFSIKNKDGEEIYRYGFNHSFAQVLTEEIIAPNESIEYEIYIEDKIKDLEPGSYNLEVWLSANNLYANSVTELVIE